LPFAIFYYINNYNLKLFVNLHYLEGYSTYLDVTITCYYNNSDNSSRH